jgi:CRISPR-associated protein Csd1
MGKLQDGHRVSREKLMQEVCSHIQTFPRHLNLEDQGLFQIGYYHQRQDMFTKATKTDEPESVQEN